MYLSVNKEVHWYVMSFSICVVFNWLMIKAPLAYGRAEYSQAGRDIYIERVDRVKEMPCRCAEGERCQAGNLPVSHSLVAVHRIIEMS